MKKPRNLADLRAEFDGTKSGCAGDTIFMAKAMMWMCEQVDKRSREPSNPIVRELRTLRLELRGQRRAEDTLATRIQVLEDSARLKDLAHELGLEARRLEADAAAEQSGGDRV